MTAQLGVLSWDYREQPDLDALARILTDLTGGEVHLHNVDTQSDQYAIVLSTRSLDRDEAFAAYEQTLHGDDHEGDDHV